jgi:subtilisin family serine protease
MKKYMILAGLLIIGCNILAQRPNWQNLDLNKDSLFGISTEKAYSTILKKRHLHKVIIAIIDSGVDTAHEDLRANIWTNQGEIPGNGIDDDHNGYIDDIHGWDFLGAEQGKEDITFLAEQNKNLYDSLSLGIIPVNYREGYHKHKEMSDIYYGHIQNLQTLIGNLESKQLLVDTILQKIGKKVPNLEDFLKYKALNEDEQVVIKKIVADLPNYKDFPEYRKMQIDTLIQMAKYHLEQGLNMKFSTASSERNKDGDANVNSDATGLVDNINSTGQHGTHVAGIIAAVRDNAIGVDGVASNAEIMVLKTNGNIRELKDATLAKAIRYAADNDARVINISMGKYYTWNKPAVDEAVKHAMEKGVLIVSAAMNNSRNIDKDTVYPNKYYETGGIAKSWIVVGASGPHDDSTLAAAFSNYGKNSVDVFAPGVGIYSTLPFNHYASWDGTSMATPVVSGLAALIWGCYPDLTAEQVKAIIMESVRKVYHNVFIKDEGGNSMLVPFSSICVSGGIVNAYNALLLAARYKSN